MKYVAAYILLTLGGKTSVTEADISAFLKAAGSEVDEAQLKAVVAALSGQSLADLSTKGLAKLGSMSFGGSGAAAAGNAAPAQAAKAAPVKEPVKEEVVEEAVDMDLGDMFG